MTMSNKYDGLSNASPMISKLLENNSPQINFILIHIIFTKHMSTSHLSRELWGEAYVCETKSY